MSKFRMTQPTGYPCSPSFSRTMSADNSIFDTLFQMKDHSHVLAMHLGPLTIDISKKWSTIDDMFVAINC